MSNRLIMKIILLTMLTASVATTVAFGQRLIEVNTTINISESLNTNGLQIETILPQTIPGRQTLLYLKSEPKPDTIIERDGLQFAVWYKNQISDRYTIKVSANLKLERYDFTIAKKQKTRPEEPDDLQYFLPLIKPTGREAKQLEKKAKGLKGNNELETVERIFEYVADNPTFTQQPEINSAGLKMVRMKPDSRKNSQLMVSLCHHFNIPSRINNGINLNILGELKAYQWVEVYLTKYGWVPFDASSEFGNRHTRDFYHLRNSYVLYSNEEDLEITRFKYDGKRNHKPKVKTKHEFRSLTAPAYVRMAKFFNEKEYEKSKIILDSLLSITPLEYTPPTLLSLIHSRQGNFELAIKHLQLAMKNAHFDTEKSKVIYYFSKYYALKEDHKSALAYLRKSIELGYQGAARIEKDEDLASIRDLKEFKELMEELKVMELNPPHPFMR